ncbi:MAG TPA: hypothetical protein VGI26_03175 [Solirubrobacteraceae bacterium]
MRKRLIILLASLACFGAFGATSAGAVEYVNHVKVESGANYFGPYVLLYIAETYPFGTAVACAGIRSVGLNCATKSGEVAGIELPWDVESEPYIHNHATFTSYFSGYYYK